ncbi:Peptidoglycan deacetylase [bioreactor metagenome]|uniref:Peptidoglycan deacetylase n=1 Tax=bioreactor metagenome TaxID=1076179 RepID=A0A645CP53_9ZZZZ
MIAKLDGKESGLGIKWPDGKRIAVMLTFDFDAEFLRMSRALRKGKKIGFTDRSRGQYGPHTGVYRCLDLLDTFDVPATFFVPGAVAETYPEQVAEIHRRGHEIACHGYLHESALTITREEEAAILQKSEDILSAVTGRRPVGHRAPESVMHSFTAELLHERGYLYSSSMKDCDFAYLHVQNGKEVPLVELPSDITMDDFTYYYFTFSDPAVRAMYTNREVIGNWKAEFDGLSREGDKIFILKLHPQMIGRASRMGMLGEMIGYMQQRGAWIATCEQVAQYVLKQEGEVRA